MPERITQPVPRFREYEIIYILRSDVDSEAAEKVASRVSEVITRENGKRGENCRSDPEAVNPFNGFVATQRP